MVFRILKETKIVFLIYFDAVSSSLRLIKCLKGGAAVLCSLFLIVPCEGG